MARKNAKKAVLIASFIASLFIGIISGILLLILGNILVDKCVE